MRVITGTARGTKLVTLDSFDTRPTASMIKECMFSSIQFDIVGANVLDLFGGSGQLGIEALSRRAGFCTFVDNNPKAIEIIHKNVSAAKVEQNAKILQKDSISYLEGVGGGFDIILLDPPFEKGILNAVVPKLERILNDGGIVMCEHEATLELPQNVGSLEQTKRYKHGKIAVTKYVKEFKENGE